VESVHDALATTPDWGRSRYKVNERTEVNDQSKTLWLHAIVLGHGQGALWRFSFVQPSILNCAPEAATNVIVVPPNNISLVGPAWRAVRPRGVQRHPV
jgi:hypothetical protein